MRAIRSYIGVNSGPNTQREHIFYEQRGGRVMYFDSPGRTDADATLASNRTAKPLTTLITAWAP